MHRYTVTTMSDNGSSVTSTHYATNRGMAAQLGKARFLEVWGRTPNLVQVEERGEVRT